MGSYCPYWSQRYPMQCTLKDAHKLLNEDPYETGNAGLARVLELSPCEVHIHRQESIGAVLLSPGLGQRKKL